MVGDWAQRYPKAQVHGAPGLAQKRTDLRFEELGKVAPPTWSTELEQCVFRGLPIFNEVVFFHRASRTLIVSDLVFHIHEARGLAPLLMRLNGMWKRFGPSRLLGWMMRRNREVSRADLERILAWDFERVVMAHGTVLEQGGRTAFERAFAFLLEKPPRGSR